MSSSKKSANKLGFFERPLFGLIYWKRIRIEDGLASSSQILKDAEKDASAQLAPFLPAFAFTESNKEWILLYNLARSGQITPKVLKNIRRSDLYFLAGHTFPHPSFTQAKQKPESRTVASLYSWQARDDTELKWDQGTKLQGNAARAKAELERRSRFWTGVLTVLAALAGGFLGSNIISSL